jgi:ABC-type dipeptide/oligopeptide/nickel transport system permease subunit
MLAALQRYNVLASYWWMWAPGLALVAVFLAYFALSEAVPARAGAASP